MNEALKSVCVCDGRLLGSENEGADDEAKNDGSWWQQMSSLE